MQQLTNAGQNIINDLSRRYNLSFDAVLHMLLAVNNGAGGMAQFNCPELGGSGQWMRGGMTMVGDMFNHGLKSKVDNLCNELANALAVTQIFPVIPAGTPGSSQWWPAELGTPFSSGAQNNTRYAIFQGRLAIEQNGNITVYDTLDHNIGGVGQQQGGNTSLTFSSQYGTITVDSLPIVSGQGSQPQAKTNFIAPPENTQAPAAHAAPVEAPQNDMPTQRPTSGQTADEIIALLEKLAQLMGAGVLTEEEYCAKKAELLKRI